MTAFVPSVIYFTIYENLMRGVSRAVDALNTSGSRLVDSIKMAFPLGVSCLAEGASLMVNVPFDLVRTRIQSGDPLYARTPVLTCIRDIVRKEGLTRPYRSSHVYIICALSFTGLQFQFLEMFRYFYKENILTVIASTIMATILTNPLDFLMTRHVLLKQGENLRLRSLISAMLK
jgi:hypothetical protein